MDASTNQKYCSLYQLCGRFESLKARMKNIEHKRELVLQALEIQEHDWYAGERVGHLVPLDVAAEDFSETTILTKDGPSTHAERYRERAYEKNFPGIHSTCNSKCGPLECKATMTKGEEGYKYVGCPLSDPELGNVELHRVLHDETW